ncbi:hypothetical protein QYM36_003415 [Artemia franciscana]|uniref:CDK5RAP3-like protein n=1 Tax=Artemia franciscana TaxID=6661 RepID=A0AA88I3L2_ARTSF|nr:hypothetical protein QYM36_003415 [Artemia franciscana]
MKDWQEIVQLYEKDNVYLAEEAQTLVRCLTYEIPAATRQIAKLQQLEEDFDRKEVECTKNAQRQRDTFFKMCRDFGLKGEQLQAEFTCLVEELPKLYEDVATAAKGLDGVVNFYEDYLKTVLKLENISDNLAVLRHIVAKGNTTVYEWKYSDPPLKVEAVPFKIESSLLNDERDPAEITTSEAIDFGATDEGGIDFGSTEDGAQGGIDFGEEENGDIDWNSIEMISASELNGDSDNNFEIVVEESGVEGGVARDTEAMTVLDYKRTRVQFIANLLELEGFFEQKLIELNSNSRQFQSLSTPIELSSQQLTEFLTQVREVLSKLEAPKLKNLILMRTSQKGVTKDEKLLVSVHLESSDSENDVTIAFQLDEATYNFSEPNETYQNQELLVARIESVVDHRAEDNNASLRRPDRWAYGLDDLDLQGRSRGEMVMDHFDNQRPHASVHAAPEAHWIRLGPIVPIEDPQPPFVIPPPRTPKPSHKSPPLII